MTTLVIGLGNSDRADDAVGPMVAGAVAGQAPPGVEVRVHEDPLDLVLDWGGRDGRAVEWVVVVDAVVSGAPAGTVRVAEIADTGPGSQHWARLGLGGTHAFGLGEALELARTLGRLPDRVTLVGVEIADVTHGGELSPAVARAVPEAIARVRELLETADVGGDRVSR